MKIKNYYTQMLGVLISAVFLVLLLAGCGQHTDPAAKANSGENKGVFRIGYQKSGPFLLLKNKKLLENHLKELGYTVEWSEFNTGISVIEALHAGSIDFGTTGDAPSLFGLARGLDFVYVASEPSAPETEGILVKKDSPIQTLSDLKGKKVAFNKASISQYLLTQALSSVGLSMKDIQPVYLNPPDASVAFAQGQVDAWVVWDPYFTAAESNGNRILKDGKGLVSYRTFYQSSRTYADQHPEVIKQTVSDLKAAGDEINKDPKEAAELLSTATKIPSTTWEKILRKKRSDPNFIDQQVIDDLQKQADELLGIGLIDKKLQVKDAVWTPKQ
jgi:sulfonate transport system substrate-binding protein